MKMSVNRSTRNSIALFFFVASFVLNAGVEISASSHSSLSRSGKSQARGLSVPSGQDLIQPEDLLSILKSAKTPKPLIIQVGFHVLYLQAHIPGSEYIGPASGQDGIRQLRKRVESLPRTQSIVLYCGCCPWSRCPNVNPAFAELHAMGFKSIKVLYIAHNLGTDWVEKGYPVEKGK